jgi:hypothetical protein
MRHTKWPSELVAAVGYPVREEGFLSRKSRIMREAASARYSYLVEQIELALGLAFSDVPEAAIDEFIISEDFPLRADKFCSVCKYFEPASNSRTTGECRKNSPAKGATRWANVSRGDWCGRFERRGGR